mmetsp:Transcript_93435/g.269884  ORF Transcript_93435/g.269884 Transcript_93435/m.269884 type:complete len:219 (+) Transcript_93435:295-951(+)
MTSGTPTSKASPSNSSTGSRTASSVRTNRSLSNSDALRRLPGSRLRHLLTKARQHADIVSGNAGISVDIPILIIAAMRLSNLPHGASAAAISMIKQPKLQMSPARPYRACAITSGAIQGMDPTVVNDNVSALHLEHPKSASLTRKSRSTSKFAPLMSRWTTGGLRVCKYARPSSNPLVAMRRVVSSKAPNSLIIRDREPPGTYSRKISNESSENVWPK